MSPLTDGERLGKLIEASLTKLEREAKRGKAPEPKALGTLSRLLERRDRAREDERLRELTAERPR